MSRFEVANVIQQLEAVAMCSQTQNQAGEPKTTPGLLSLYLQPHLLLSPTHVPLGSLLGGKAVQMEAVRPPGCLFSTDTHHNLKENMSIATKTPGSPQETGVTAMGSGNIPLLRDHKCSQAVRRDVKRRAGTPRFLYLYHVTGGKRRSGSPGPVYCEKSISPHAWCPWWLVKHREGHQRAQKLLTEEIPKSRILPCAAAQ